jgi:DNA-binding SARP family transcriptional activator
LAGAQRLEQDDCRLILQIISLGDFRVKFGEKVLTQEANRSYRLWELFKYLLTNKDQVVLPEVLVEKLWPEQEYADAKSAVRTMVYRLRRILASATGKEGDSYILFDHGSYRWNPEAQYKLDAEEFEKLCLQAENLKQKNPTQAIVPLQKALSLYKGEYLPEAAFSEWTIMQRQYYQRLYLDSVVTLCGLLKNTGQFAEIIGICEDAVNIEPYSEQIHILYIEALIAQGKKSLAMSHYGYITDTLYRELGIKPSKSMIHLHKMIKASGRVAEYDLTLIQQELRKAAIEQGGFICDVVVFRELYQLELRRVNRNENNIALGLLTLIKTGYEQDVNTMMEHLQNILKNFLRGSDIVTRLNNSQFLVLLTDTDYIEAKEKILERIEQEFWKSNSDHGFLIAGGCSTIEREKIAL